MLVESARAESVPRVELCCNSQVCEPVELDSLPVSLRLVSRNYLEVLCHLLELCLADRVLTLCSLFCQKLSVSFAEDHDSIAVDHHCLELVLLLESFRIVHEIESVDGFLDLYLIVSVSLDEYVLASACVSRASLLHELCEHAGSICFFPLFSHAVEQLVSHRFALPVRDDQLFLILEILLCDRVVYDSSVVHDVHVFESVACELRECRRRLRVLSLFTYDKLAFSEVESLSAEVLLQYECPQYREGYLVFPLLIDLCLDLRSFEIDVRLCLHADLSQRFDPCVHSAFFHFVLRPA